MSMKGHARGSLDAAENLALRRIADRREVGFRSSDRGTTHADRRRSAQRRALLGSTVTVVKKVEVKPKTKKVAKKV